MTSQMGRAERIIIVGGGLSGLITAYLLAKTNISTTVLEASPRLGGRIQTVMGLSGTPLELGATWFSDAHPHLLALLQELGLTIYPQYSNGISLFQTKSFEPPQEFFIPGSASPSYRVAGGTQQLIEALMKKIPAGQVWLNAAVTTIEDTGDQLLLEIADGRKWQADKVVLCMPPQLAATRIKFAPELPEAARAVLSTVQTWMAGAIKFTLEYEVPFWRSDGYSGMLYSHAGIITEMYDHTNFEENKFGFTGFLNGGAASYPQQLRKELVLQQLSGLLGERAAMPVAYFDKIWTNEFILEGAPVFQAPHYNNGHPLLQLPYMGGKLFFCGTETAPAFAGYMEGAVIAAKEAVKRFM